MFNESDAPQPPKVLSTPLEIAANLRQLQESHDPLIITFHDRSQRFQSYVIAVDRDKNLLILDELVPNDGERYLANGETYRYVSGCNLNTEIGKMFGTYLMERVIDKKLFFVRIPEFKMIVPGKLN